MSGEWMMLLEESAVNIFSGESEAADEDSLEN